jgi:dihydropteroate synthase
MQGEPQTMQASPHYQNVAQDIINFLQQRIDVCVDAGIKRSQIVVDPGFGFGKTLQHNIELMQKLEQFEALNCPVLVGVSRKSMIDKWLHRSLDQRLPGSLALALLALQRGARIIRVHDVAATFDILKIQQVIDLESAMPT